MKKYLLIAPAVALFLMSGSVVLAEDGSAVTTSVATTAQVTFPIAELGNCASKDACRVYCAEGAHQEACLKFGEAHKLMTKDETARVRDLKEVVGPGGCKGAQACKTYCADTTHHDECAIFADEHRPPGKKEEPTTSNGNAKASLPGLPGLIASYCAREEHFNECLAFARAHNLVDAVASTTTKIMPMRPPQSATGTPPRDIKRPPPPPPIKDSGAVNSGAAVFFSLRHLFGL